MDLPIETERLLLRRYRDKDLAVILEFSSDADLWRARNLDWDVSEKGVKAYWEAQRGIDPYIGPEWFSLAVVLKAKERVIGQVGLGVVTIREHRQGTIGWLPGRKHQGQGLATEAVRAMVA